MSKITKKASAWSFSRYSDYKQCPFKFKLKHIDRIKEPPNAAMERGAHIHELAEQYIKGQLRTMPKELKLFAEDFKMLRKEYKRKLSGMVVEDSWALTKEWDETVWNDWAKCYLRIKLDCAHFEDEDAMVVTDWKTGKFRANQNEAYIEQLELYALATLILKPHVKQVRPVLKYLDEGVVYPPEEAPMIFTQADVPKLKKLWEKRIKPMMNDARFAPRPNNLCGWCFFSKSKGGPCKY